MCYIDLWVIQMKRLHKSQLFPSIPFYARQTRLTDAPDQSGLHDHDFYEVFVVEEGHLQHRINGQTEILYPDTLVLIHPEDCHEFSCKEKSGATFFNLAFDHRQFEQAKRLAEQCAPSTRFASLQSRIDLPHPLCRLLARRMRWLQDTFEPVPQEIQQTTGLTLLADILVLCAAGGNPSQPVPYWLRKACAEMHQPENLAQGIPRLVEVSGKSQEHLTRSMQRYLSTTPSAYINNLRLERAAHLLTTTDRGVYHVMLEVGFQNTSYFNKLFREKYRLSPRKYRASVTSILGKAE